MEQHSQSRRDEGWGESAVPIPLYAAAFNGQIASGRWLLCGWSLFNSSTNAGNLNLYDGASTGDRRIATIALAASGFNTQWLDIEGVRIELGLYQQIVGGLISGVVYLRPASLIEYGRKRRYTLAELEAYFSGRGDPRLHSHDPSGHAADSPAYG